MLKVEGLNQYYGGSHILRGLSFEARAAVAAESGVDIESGIGGEASRSAA